MFTKIKAYIGLAYKTFSKRKLHFFLSFLGVLVGMITLTVVLTITEGNKIQIKKTMEAMGSDLIWVQFSEGISVQDAYKLASFKNFETIAPMNAMIVTYSQNKKVLVYGVDENYFKTKSYKILNGRLIHKLDVTYQKQVAVIEGSYNKSWIDLNHIRYQVIGSVELKYQSDDIQNSIIYIPISLVRGKVHKIYLKPVNKVNVLSQISAISNKIKLLYPNDNFTVSCAEALIRTTKQVNNLIISLALMLTTAILITGGVGIMNVLIISVKERTKEIGLRKALGATKQDILLQFLIEGSLISFAGGFIGLLVGLFSAFIISKLTNSLPIAINGIALSISVFVLLFISIISSYYPSLKASKLSPAIALTGQD